ncbi:MAG: SMP-30/gluconolactonase/LRE family protein, partial [Rhizobiaceae bacterium]
MSVSVLSSISCHLGEGPSFDPRTGTLWWFDILGQKLHGLHMTTGATSEISLPVMGSAIFSVDDDRQMILTERGFYIRFRA